MLLKRRLPISYIFKKAKRNLIIVSVISVFIYFVQQQLIYLLPQLPITIPVFVGTAISLILSFNLNQAYERWWEARKVWGSIVNDSRTLIVQLKSFTKPGNEKIISEIAHRQIAWCYCLGASLRKQNATEGISPYLSAEDCKNLDDHQNKPLALLDQHAGSIRGLLDGGQIDTFHHVQLDSTLVRLCDGMGKAERINTTVFPTTYSLFLHSFIYIFIVLLSISLSEIDGFFEIPLLIIITVPFLMLEQTVKDMQDPFSGYATDTPVTAIARTIEINLKQLIGDPDVPEPLADHGFYID